MFFDLEFEMLDLSEKTKLQSEPVIEDIEVVREISLHSSTDQPKEQEMSEADSQAKELLQSMASSRREALELVDMLERLFPNNDAEVEGQ